MSDTRRYRLLDTKEEGLLLLDTRKNRTVLHLIVPSRPAYLGLRQLETDLNLGEVIPVYAVATVNVNTAWGRTGSSVVTRDANDQFASARPSGTPHSPRPRQGRTIPSPASSSPAMTVGRLR